MEDTYTYIFSRDCLESLGTFRSKGIRAYPWRESEPTARITRDKGPV